MDLSVFFFLSYVDVCWVEPGRRLSVRQLRGRGARLDVLMTYGAQRCDQLSFKLNNGTIPRPFMNAKRRY